MKCNQSGPGFDLVSPCPFPTTITNTPRAPPNFGWADNWGIVHWCVTDSPVQHSASYEFFMSFSYSQLGCLITNKQPKMPYYFTHSKEQKRWIHAFPKWNGNSILQDRTPVVKSILRTRTVTMLALPLETIINTQQCSLSSYQPISLSLFLSLYIYIYAFIYLSYIGIKAITTEFSLRIELGNHRFTRLAL